MMAILEWHHMKQQVRQWPHRSAWGIGVAAVCAGLLLPMWHPLGHAQALNTPELGDLLKTNPFDDQRKLWPDRTPLPPPPPVPAAITDQDLEVVGVLMAGVQKAWVKPGKRFQAVPTAANGMAALQLGAQVGEFVLAQIQPDQVLLRAPGGEQWLRVSAASRRAATSVAMAPSNAAVSAPLVAAVAPVAPPPVFVQAAPVNVGSGPASGGMPPIMNVGGVAPSAIESPAADPAAAAAAAQAPAGSLAAAIAAVRSSAPAGGGSAAPVNPFEALLKGAGR